MESRVVDLNNKSKYHGDNFMDEKTALSKKEINEIVKYSKLYPKNGRKKLGLNKMEGDVGEKIAFSQFLGNVAKKTKKTKK
jgi:hypothetical protein